MIKKNFILIFTLLFMAIPAFAQKIPVKIAPTEVISTHHDEIQVGDYISFEVVNDVYLKEKLYIPKGNAILGKVEFYHPNGWAGDHAEIFIKQFYTKDSNNKTITINYPLAIIRTSDISNDWKQSARFIKNILWLIRGSEIFIEPDTRTFNIFIEQ